MTLNLDTLRKIAEAATPGPWEASDRGIGYEVHDASAYELNSGMRETFTESDATHIATFDPPTVLALLSRLEQAEQAVQRVREAMGKPWGSAITAKHIIRRALDGDGRG